MLPATQRAIVVILLSIFSFGVRAQGPGSTFFGLDHTSVGQAQLGQDPTGALQVSNLGATGQDGSDDTAAIQNALTAAGEAGPWSPESYIQISKLDYEEGEVGVSAEIKATIDDIDPVERAAVVTVGLARGSVAGNSSSHSGSRTRSMASPREKAFPYSTSNSAP